jgi:hypothetical protein
VTLIATSKAQRILQTPNQQHSTTERQQHTFQRSIGGWENKLKINAKTKKHDEMKSAGRERERERRDQAETVAAA